MKPLYKILIAIGVVIIAGGAVYLAWQKLTSPLPTEPEPGASLPGAGAAPSGGGQNGGGAGGAAPPTAVAAPTPTLRKISEFPAFDLWAAEGTGEVYYLTPEGKVMNVKEGPDLEISTQTLTALNRAAAAPGGGRVLAAFGDPRAPQWAYFDIIDQSWHPLPQNVLSTAWAGRGDQIVALARSGSEINLSLLNLAQTPPTAKVILRDMSFQDVTLWFQNPEQLIVVERPSAYHASRVWRLDLKTLSFNAMLAPERGLLIAPARGGEMVLKWSPDWLSMLNRNFERGAELPFSTFPEKCTASPDTLYCFVPREPLPENIPLPDAYYQGKFRTVDSLIVTALASSTLSIGRPESPWSSIGESPVDAKTPVYASGNLYFINRYDNYVYKLTLGTTGN